MIPAVGDLTRDCHVFLKDRQVSSLGCFVFDFWVLRFRDLGAPFSSFRCSVFEIWVLRASVFVFETTRAGVALQATVEHVRDFV